MVKKLQRVRNYRLWQFLKKCGTAYNSGYTTPLRYVQIGCRWSPTSLATERYVEFRQQEKNISRTLEFTFSSSKQVIRESFNSNLMNEIAGLNSHSHSGAASFNRIASEI